MLTNQVEIFRYNGSPVSFQKGDNVMINATEMAKPFGKNASHWLRNKSTEAFIKELSALRNRKPTELVQVTNGGNNFGCWMHKDVAIEFARWLSPAFAIWCNDRIEELFKTGVATINDDDATIAHAMQILSQRLEKAQAEKQLLQEKTEQQEQVIQQQAESVRYLDRIQSSVSTYTVTQIAKEFGLSAESLNRKLHELKVQFKQNGQWLLYADYQDKGYTKTITREHLDHLGNIRTSQQTVWTETGRRFIHKLLD
jgi:phage antirepressor YoqD-like protein